MRNWFDSLSSRERRDAIESWTLVFAIVAITVIGFGRVWGLYE